MAKHKRAAHRVGAKKSEGNKKKSKFTRSSSISSRVRKNVKKDHTAEYLDRITSLESELTKAKAEWEEEKAAIIAEVKAAEEAKHAERVERAAREGAERASQTQTMKDLFCTTAVSRRTLESLRRDARFAKIPADLLWFVNHGIQLPNRPWVFFDISVGGHVPRRIVMELYSDIAPHRAENFHALCTGERGMGRRGKPLHYKGCPIHQVAYPSGSITGGDITNGDGTGGESIYGEEFYDIYPPPRSSNRGDLYMNTTQLTSMFRIALKQHISVVGVFGRVVQGMEVVDAIAALHDGLYRLTSPVVIVNCGQL